MRGIHLHLLNKVLNLELLTRSDIGQEEKSVVGQHEEAGRCTVVTFLPNTQFQFSEAEESLIKEIHFYPEILG